MIRFACILALLPFAALAQDWQVMTGDDINAALSDRALVYDDGSFQTFSADGETLYNAGEDTFGSWNVQGDKYCSVWPPSADWVCYAMDTADGVFRFLGDDGSAFPGRYRE